MVPNSLSSKGFFLPPSKMLHTPPPNRVQSRCLAGVGSGPPAWWNTTRGRD